jgi:hypothetical protein
MHSNFRHSLNRMNYRVQLRYLAIIAFVLAVVATGLGGWANMTGKPLVVTERHAWNDGLFLVLAAIFLLLMSLF